MLEIKKEFDQATKYEFVIDRRLCVQGIIKNGIKVTITIKEPVQVPHIDSVVPDSGKAGDSVTINGSHFGTSGTAEII